MKPTLIKNSIILLFLFFLSVIYAQNDKRIWIEDVDVNEPSLLNVEKKTLPKKYKVYSLNYQDLELEINNAPHYINKNSKSNKVVSFPNEKGELERYEIFESAVFSKELKNQFPGINSYVGKSIDSKGKTIRFSMSKLGFHAMILKAGENTVYIDPYLKSKKSYMIYERKELPKNVPLVCNVDDLVNVSNKLSQNEKTEIENVDDGVMRTFRLAIATTGEYSQFQLIYHGISQMASENEKKEAVLAAINITMTRVNGIFERDLSLTMQLVGNNKDIIFLDPVTDGFTNDEGFDLIDESQAIIDANIGSAAYDIGHTFSTGGGGLAELRSPCTSSKAKGITGSSFPVGDAYNVDYVAHEMGHQFGANHTFNSAEGSCGGGNRNNATSVEPGSGSTIMAYAGLCAPDNIQSQGDDYFHLVSINEMFSNISSGSSTCATITTTNNREPEINPLNNYTIPISTPFVLNATATDEDGDDLTYTWEQLDTEITTAPPITTANQGPVFRSLPPSSDSERYFPNLETVLDGNVSNTWEALPSVGRTLDFGVNVRDNNPNGGQSASLENTITVDGSSGPFVLTSQNTSENWSVDEIKTITWDVANTNNAPVNCANVNILLSTDGGYTYPITLASSVSNNGSATITVPNVTTINGRIKIEAVNNIFYAVNAAEITIQAKEFTMDFSSTEISVCKTNDALVTFTYNTFLGFNEVTTFSVNGNPVGTSVSFNPSTATADGTTVELTISGLSGVALGEYPIEIIGTSGTSSMIKTQQLTLAVYDANLMTPSLIEPADATLGILKPYTLNWSSDVNDVEYEVQIATDNGFSSIVEQTTISTNSFNPTLLTENTQYFWRIKAKNSCGESSFSSVFSFTTANESCSLVSSADTPLSIPDNSETGATSIINVSNNLTISDVKVSVNITHTWTSDLGLSIESPSGIVILLSVNNGSDGDDYTNTIFDDEALAGIETAAAPFTGSFRPQIPLSLLDGENSLGDWKLKVVDSGVGDNGIIVNWSIEICGVPAVIGDDDDGDGVSNADDLCPNTTNGALVDSTGCFMLAADNFEIETISETCHDENNGQILIATSNTNYSYTTTSINGNIYNFSSGESISNLPDGTYDFCIAVDGENYEQCFSVVIEPGVQIGGKATVKNEKLEIEISEGSAPFSIFLNGVFSFETNESLFDVNVNQGDLVEVYSKVACEGVLAKKVDFVEAIYAYPNPFVNQVSINVPTAEKGVFVEVFNTQSQLILSKNYSIENNTVQLSLEGKPTGLYVIKLHMNNNIKVLKILKK